MSGKNMEEKLLDKAQYYIQTVGYNGFSYLKLSQDLGIKTSSIHYYFRKKEQLGIAVVKRLQGMTLDLQASLSQDPHLTTFEKLEGYLELFHSIFGDMQTICPCGALAGEFWALPQAMQNEVIVFFDIQLDWLESFLEAARASGDFSFELSSLEMAQFIFSSLEGSLIVARSKQNAGAFDATIRCIKHILGFESKG